MSIVQVAPDHELGVLQEILAGLPVDPPQELLLPALLEVQARLGFVSQGAIRFLAQAFNLSRADVYGVVTFYHDLRETPVGDTVIQVCMAEACQSVGCRSLAAHAQQKLGVELGQTTQDGRYHLEAVYCLGNCALGPNVRVGDRVYGNVTPARFDQLVQR